VPELRSKRPRPPYNPGMLRWAREWRGLSADAAGRAVDKTAADILAWETPNSGAAPTVKQARRLADVYGRAFIEFFRTAPPSEKPADITPDYRLHREVQSSEQAWQLRTLQEWATSQRLNTLDLFSTLGEEVPHLPAALRASVSDNVENVALVARNALNFPASQQITIPRSARDKFPNVLRAKFESAGILTLKHSDLKKIGARGLCLAHDILPAIVYTSESPGAQAFTLAHELGHVLLRASAVSDKEPYARLVSARRPTVERWCDRFSAAFLMPKDALGIIRPRPVTPLAQISNEEITSLADLFKVSKHAMLIRLVNLRYVEPSFYWERKRPEYIREEEDFESFARSKYYGSRYRSSLGDLYTGLVIEAWNTGKITNHNASEFMGIKNMEHLFRIREEFNA
jgi:Zn-dependent peptidase ImmA (M78 family)